MRIKWIKLVLLLGTLLPFRAPAAEPVAPFAVGEKLHYRIYWGPVAVGSASLEVRSRETVDGHECFHIVAEARTEGVGRMLYPMNSVTESWLDVAGLFSRRFHQNRQEGRRTKHSETRYDYVAKESVTKNLVNGREKRRPLEHPVQDIVSSLYYMRQQPLALNREETFTLNANDENWQVRVQPDHRQNINLRPVGEVPALRLEPDPPIKFVAANKGRMWFWLSDDQRRLPLMVTSTMAIGSGKLVLTKVEQRATVQLPGSAVVGLSQ